MKGCLRLGSALWSLDSTAWGAELVAIGGHQPKAANSCARTESVSEHAIVPEKVLLNNFIKFSDKWFRQIQKEPIRPNAEQLEYLMEIKDRCEVEVQEAESFANTKKQDKPSEPYRKGLLGPPGTGKSECLRWTRRFFEEVLGWTDGVQFQMVAPQHTMALLVGGKTVHAWSSTHSRYCDARGKEQE